MTSDTKFRKRKQPTVEVSFHCSINLAPENEWTKEETRVNLWLWDEEGEDYNNRPKFDIFMSRAEAKSLGQQLLDYGTRVLKHEKGQGNG